MSEERLEDGTSTTTPVGDNLVLGFARTQAAAYHSLAGTPGAVHEDDHELGLSMNDTGSATPFGNTTEVLRPMTAERVGDLAERLRTFYGSRDGGPYIVFSPWPTPDLRPSGFHLVGHPPLMLRPAAALPHPQSNLRVERVDSLDALEDFERVLVDGFPIEELQPWRAGRLLGAAVLETAWRLFLGFDGDRAVATSAAYRDEVSIVEQVAVLPEARGKGYGFDITAAATTPDVPSLLVASDPGQPVYERLGYLRLLRYTLWVGTR